MTEEKQNSFFRFEDLRLYFKAIDYSNFILDITKDFPQDYFEKITNRFIQASLDIAFYIAEGAGKNRTLFINHLEDARSSIRESVVLNEVSFRAELMDEDTYFEVKELLMELSRMQGALVSSLHRNGKKHHQETEQQPNQLN